MGVAQFAAPTSMRRVAPQTTDTVPFLDLRSLHAGLREDVLAEIAEIIDSASFVNGSQVAAFEEQFASAVGVAHCLGVASGLDALRLALATLDLEPGAEVVVPAMTFVATWEAVSQVGAVPVPVDVSELDYALDVGSAAAAVSDRTGAIMPVHLYGQMADMAGLAAVSERHGIPLIEDAARRTARSATAGGQAQRVTRRGSASIPARTSVRWATPARS